MGIIIALYIIAAEITKTVFYRKVKCEGIRLSAISESEVSALDP